MTAKLNNTIWAYDKMIDQYIYLDESSFDLSENNTEYQNTVQEKEIWKQLSSSFGTPLKELYIKKFECQWEDSDVYLDYFKVENNTLLLGVRNWEKVNGENTFFEIKSHGNYANRNYTVSQQDNDAIQMTISKDGPVQMEQSYFESNFMIQERVEQVVEYYHLPFSTVSIGDYTGPLVDSYYDGAYSEFQLWDRRGDSEEYLSSTSIGGIYGLLEFIYEQFGVDYREKSQA